MRIMAQIYKIFCIFAKLFTKSNLQIFNMKLTKLFSATAFLLLALTAISCSNGASTTSTSTSQDAVVTDGAGIAYTGKIAFIRMDSLMNGYGLYMDLGSEFTKKQQNVQKELENKGRSLEREVMEFQEKAQKGLITTYQARTTEENLQKKQQQILTYRDKVLGELANEEAIIGAQISDAIFTYLQEYNADKKYSMILQTMGGNPVIIADPALDITGEVLAELNKRYEATLTKK